MIEYSEMSQFSFLGFVIWDNIKVLSYAEINDEDEMLLVVHVDLN